MPTGIEWCDETWNPVTGCSPVSAGCDHCYARRMAYRLAGRYGYPKESPFRPTFHDDRLAVPGRWKKARRVFVCSMGDLFHEGVDFKWINSVMGASLAAYRKNPRHVWLFLTKRPEGILRWRDWVLNASSLKVQHIVSNAAWFFRKAWVGVTVENQEMAEERIPVLLSIPAAKRFVSVEPMLGPVDLTRVRFPHGGVENVLNGNVSDVAKRAGVLRLNTIDWVICGGETGPGARPMDPYWVTGLGRQCVHSEVPFFFKSWGEWLVLGRVADAKRVGKKNTGHLVFGGEFRQFPLGLG